MKTRLFWITILLLAVITLPSVAQTNLVGSVYKNDNIMKKELNEITKDMDQKVAKAKAEEVAKAEKKKGRKLTAAEVAEIDKKLNEGQVTLEAMMKGMNTSITFTFKTADQAVMNMDMSISDDAMKAAGIGWLKRKALKAALAIAPSSQKVKYVIQGDLVICSDGKEKDTLRMSKDHQFLYGKMDGKTPFTLKRVK